VPQSRPGCWVDKLKTIERLANQILALRRFAQTNLLQQLFLLGELAACAIGISARPSDKLSRFNVNLRIPGPNPVLIHLFR
jgi:hypothetical protein